MRHEPRKTRERYDRIQVSITRGALTDIKRDSPVGDVSSNEVTFTQDAYVFFVVWALAVRRQIREVS
jgi:hypothetical protein